MVLRLVHEYERVLRSARDGKFNRAIQEIHHLAHLVYSGRFDKYFVRIVASWRICQMSSDQTERTFRAAAFFVFLRIL